MNEQYVFVFANSLTSYCPLREELSISNWTKYLLAIDNQLPYSVTCFASFPDIHAMGEGHGPDVWNHLQFILMGSHHRRFLQKTAFKSSQIPLQYRRNTSHHTGLIHLLLTCSFEAQKPPLCSGRCSHCDPRLRTLFPLRWQPRLPHGGWSTRTRTPSGAFVGQIALRSSGVNCHQNHL